MLDIDLIDQSGMEDGSWLAVDLPSTLAVAGEVRIKLVSANSRQGRDAHSWFRRELTKNKIDPDDTESDDFLRLDQQLYARMTLAWEGIASKGEPWPFSREHAELLYRAQPWILFQVRTFVFTDANFIKLREATPQQS